MRQGGERKRLLPQSRDEGQDGKGVHWGSSQRSLKRALQGRRLPGFTQNFECMIN